MTDTSKTVARLMALAAKWSDAREAFDRRFDDANYGALLVAAADARADLVAALTQALDQGEPVAYISQTTGTLLRANIFNRHFDDFPALAYGWTPLYIARKD
jgi:ankyrin repeat protein